VIVPRAGLYEAVPFVEFGDGSLADAIQDAAILVDLSLILQRLPARQLQ